MSTSPTQGHTAGPGSGGGRFQVVVGATIWAVNGVNVFSTNLTRGLLAAGIDAHIVLTEDETALIQSNEILMPHPAGVPMLPLPVSPMDGWGAHWGAMVRHLEAAAPCVYIPNCDWRHSCVCPRLSDSIVIVGVVHSDDPLHYDHVRRLGPSWNAIVAVSSAVAERTAQECPSVADRIVTIQNGAPVPAVRPSRADRGPTAPLRVVYHGALKQHQKRVLDLPAIAHAAVERGVPIELSIAGAGPEEAALRAASATLVEQGVIRFLGVVSPDDTAALLESQDVYLLASEFEGMPNALIEAMGRGCVPVVSQMTSGIPELVRDSDNGFLAPIGDVRAFADRLHLLWSDPARREAMSARAFQTIVDGRFRAEDMVDAYRRVFDRAWEEARTGRFVRTRGPLSLPPPAIAGVNVFPVKLPHIEPGIGAFPSAEDADDYKAQLKAASIAAPGLRVAARDRTRTPASRASLEGTTVILSVPAWTADGENLWSEDVARGLRQAGLDVRLLLTEEESQLVRCDAPRLARPSDIPFAELRFNGIENWGAHWGAMRRTLEAAAPCVYFPGPDRRHSCVVPTLSDAIIVIGTLHSGADIDMEHAARLGEYWNAVVTTNLPTARHIRRQLPGLQERLSIIPHGLDVPEAPVEKPEPSAGKARALFLGASQTGREPTNWAEALVEACRESGETLRIVIVDPPSPLGGTLAELGVETVRGLNRREWLDLCTTSDFVVTNDPGDDARRMVVEAMGHRCVPVWIASGSSDDSLVRDGDNGIVAQTGEWGPLAKRLGRLASDFAERTRMAGRAHSAARTAGYRTDQMIDAYVNLIGRLVEERNAGTFKRRRGSILPQPSHMKGLTAFSFGRARRTEWGTFPTRADAERFQDESGLDVHPHRWAWPWQ